MLHPEGGHILLNRHPEDTKGGVCPSHPNCFEGFASGPSIEARWGKKAVDLKEQSEVWELESFYIAQALADYYYDFVAPEDHPGRRRYASGAAVPVNPKEGKGACKRLYLLQRAG